MNKVTKKNEEVREEPGLLRQYEKPVLADLGDIVTSTFGSGANKGDKGSKGKRN